ncbi:LPXTG cell wall anchor domain-containing protein [Streptomyces lavendulocolor]|uniref:LPXTG cell wall anchor domain-containing protein n=1 Tax=Streptomyces lavendulocolor TaxID=67316 RepID=A0ABV2W3V3_9ACTN
MRRAARTSSARAAATETREPRPRPPSAGGNDATQGASGAPTDESASPGPLSTTPAEPSGGAGASPAAEDPAGTGDDSGPAQNGGSGPLAETGGSNPVLPLGIAAAVLGLGGGLLVVARRKRARH